MHKKILSIIEEKQVCTQGDIAKEIDGINRAILLGYLRCMTDLNLIKSKMSGRTIVYFSLKPPSRTKKSN